MRKIILICFFLFITLKITPQSKVFDYINPIKTDLIITGSFGEVRDNHFHSGIDFSIGGKEGMPVYAVADGVVSRIKISAVGYGNALYIDHADGVTSVYGHLQKYNSTITQYARENQYKAKSFEVDLFPAQKKEYIKVKKGDLIAYAGNSGGSGGPHLHFELRETKSEKIINPLRNGFSAPDKYNPFIDFINIYPDDINTYINGNTNRLKCTVKKISANEYVLANNKPIEAWGKVYFGIQAFDYNYSAYNRNGWYKLEMKNDGKIFFSMSCDKFAFDESRYVNASIDYLLNYKQDNRIVISKKLPGNKLSFFETDENLGVLDFTDGKSHAVNMQVEDASGKYVTLRFVINSVKPSDYKEDKEVITESKFAYNKSNIFKNEDVIVNIPEGALYDDIDFVFRKQDGGKAYYSPVCILHTPETPLHTKVEIKIKTVGLPDTLQSKALLMRMDDKGRKKPVEAYYMNGYVVGKNNSWGKYAVVVDTTSPVIIPSKYNKKGANRLRFIVTDDFSGVKKYTGKVNGKWALVEYDAKNDLMTYNVDWLANEGENNFDLEVEDYKGNKTFYSTVFYK